MKLDVIFKIQSIIDNRVIPVDILQLLDNTYYSKSKEKDVPSVFVAVILNDLP